MRDIYLNPTVASLAAHLGAVSLAEIAVARSRYGRSASRRDLEYYGCGALHLMFYSAYGLLGLWIFTTGVDLVHRGDRQSGRALPARLGSLLGGRSSLLTAIPLVVKWLLVGVEGRGDPGLEPSLLPLLGGQESRLRRSDRRISGTPIYHIYLRMLGAKIGANAVIASLRAGLHRPDSRSEPIRSCARTLCCSATRRGQLSPHRLDQIGANAYVGQAGVFDIHTVMEDGTQFGHASSLPSGQRVPRGKHYHGSPAQETEADYCTIGPGTAARSGARFIGGFPLIGASSPPPIADHDRDSCVCGLRSIHRRRRAHPRSVVQGSGVFATAVLACSRGFVFCYGTVGRLHRSQALPPCPARGQDLRALRGSLFVHRACHGAEQLQVFLPSPVWRQLRHRPLLEAIGYGLHKIDQTGSNFRPNAETR